MQEKDSGHRQTKKTRFEILYMDVFVSYLTPFHFTDKMKTLICLVVCCLAIAHGYPGQYGYAPKKHLPQPKPVVPVMPVAKIKYMPVKPIIPVRPVMPVIHKPVIAVKPVIPVIHKPVIPVVHKPVLPVIQKPVFPAHKGK